MQPVLTVNLTTEEIGQFSIPSDWEKEYLGGASLAARMLYDQLTLRKDPLSPESPLLFLTGPLTGTAGPAVGRFVITGRSPATGLWAESNCGGFWGPELRKAGLDGVWITGRAEKPVYLWIHTGEITLRDASHLWGLDTYQTQTALQESLPEKNLRVATIGPAGESLIPFALILCDHGRVAGRTGLGAVMGSKNLKAIAVKGSGQIPIADTAGFQPVRARANREMRNENKTRALREMGTASGADYFDYLGEMPKKYFSTGVDHAAGKISGATIAETILAGVSACHACVIACGRVVRLEDGEKRKGPEYETLVGFGPNLLISDTAAITRMGELCDRYGMDTISLSNTIGLAFKLYDEGLLAAAETGGLQLKWGDADMVMKCIHLAARREGFGAWLAEGSLALARQVGAEEMAVQVNGLEVAYHDPRGASGMALVYATSPRGACHNQSDYFMVDALGEAEEELGIALYGRQAGAEKAANVARHQDWRTVFNALGMCDYSSAPPDTVVELTNKACGYDLNLQELLASGERGWNLKRLINIRLGLRGENDRLPKAFLEPYPDGGSAGYMLDFTALLSAYYTARGWDPNTGFPAPATLTRLGLGPLIADLNQA